VSPDTTPEDEFLALSVEKRKELYRYFCVNYYIEYAEGFPDHVRNAKRLMDTVESCGKIPKSDALSINLGVRLSIDQSMPLLRQLVRRQR
jgi:hypothetical protein